ncbi:MAG TPA: ABC transporter ATP-binding protein [Thermoflexales bacterium]|nr:ABC transporter ATP-binding protein [Thermoflexales bacterium]HQY23529.1 ABC transporter ATP-binding protein [Thermoflexales bacterium]HQZ52660.1 ABC transporter ATP-binding protein [Thermoflexales bacterium]HRA52880.1 ABC transporter ATP-binding protein [Thermoflexales bacterium]
MNIPLSSYRRLLGRYLAPQRGRAVLMAAALLAGIALDVSGPQIVRQFIDRAMAGVPVDGLVGLAGLYIVIVVSRQATAVGATWLGENVGWSATNALRADLALHCLTADLSFHNARTPGELVERIDGDVTALAAFFSQLTIKVVGNLLLLLAVLAALFAEDWRLGLALTAFAGLALWLLIKLRSFAVPYWLRVRAKAAEFAGFVTERLSGIEDLRGIGAVSFTMRQFHRLLREWMPLQVKGGLAGMVMWSVTVLTFAAGTGMALLTGASLWRAGLLTLGGVYLVFAYTELIRQPIEQIRQQMDELQRAGASIVRIEKLFAVKSALLEPAAQIPARVETPLPAGPLSVHFDRVTFHYDDERPVLRDVSFSLPAGAVLGLLGRTGAGKSTLAKLLLRMYDPQSGAIRLDPPAGEPVDGSVGRCGGALRDMTLAEARRRVGLVTQEVQIFHASVRDNLTFFDDGIPDSRIRAEIESLGLAKWLARLPNGLDTPLKTAEAGLSAGEAQLLAFGRIFLRQPSIVVLDEASSKLDPATEQRIERAVDRLLADRTGIVIAHRLATVERADYILILDDGEVAEFGPREALARNPDSRFAALLQAGLEEVLV